MLNGHHLPVSSGIEKPLDGAVGWRVPQLVADHDHMFGTPRRLDHAEDLAGVAAQRLLHQDGVALVHRLHERLYALVFQGGNHQRLRQAFP